MRSSIKKSIAIIGEGETEWFYFDSLRIYHRFPFKIAPDFPRHSDIDHILKLAKRYLDEEYDYVICLIDMDRIKQVSAEWKKYQLYKNKERTRKKRKDKHIIFVETFPCMEFWFLLHFIPNLSTKKYNSYEDILVELRKYMHGYEKTKKYFRQINLYPFLKENGDENRAVENAKKLCELNISEFENKNSYSELYRVIELLNELKTMKS